MGKIVSGLMLALAVSVFSLPGVSQAPSGGASKGIPDLSGVWDRPGAGNLARISPTGPEALSSAGGGGGGYSNFIVAERPSMTTWGKERYDAVRVGLKDYDDQPPDALDHERYCYPRGPTRMFTGGAWPFEIRQMADVVFFFFERDHWVRRVFMDGRGHPDGYLVTWMGHSIGKYEPDTLVVDTVLVNDITWIDGLGHPHSTDAQFTERFRRSGRDQLEYTIRVDDPKAYTKPWEGKRVFEVMPRSFEIMEHVICEELLEMGAPRNPQP